MYGRHFESMYTGSMYGQGYGLFAVWGWVISHERGGIVEINPKMLADLFGESVESVSTLVNKLCQPDDDSRSTEQEGRRLERIGQFAYQVVNAAEYAKIASEADRREYLKIKQREHRARQQVSTGVNKNIPSDSDAEANANKEKDEESRCRCYGNVGMDQGGGGMTTTTNLILKAWEKLPLPEDKKYPKEGEWAVIERAVSNLALDTEEPVHEGMILEAIENYKAALKLPKSQTFKHKLFPFLTKHIRKYVSYNFDIEHHDGSQFGAGGKSIKKHVEELRKEGEL